MEIAIYYMEIRNNTVNSEIITCIYYNECSNGDDNASFIFATFQKA